MPDSTRQQALAALEAVLTAVAGDAVMPATWPGQPEVTRIRPNPDATPAAGAIYIGRGRLSMEIVEFGAGAGKAPREHMMTVPIELYFSHADEDLQERALDVILTELGKITDDSNALNQIVETCEIPDADVQRLGDENLPPEIGALVNVVLTWTAAPLA